MTSDYYAILGVTPTAEGVVISAAYRALIRHYHPDTNPDPEAQAKTREITAAYAVLRDPEKRADYDAQRAADDQLWLDPVPADRPPAPAMRGVGIASALLALALVGAVWAWPPPDRPTEHPHAGLVSEQAISTPPPTRAEPVVELQPESERLANLRRDAEILNPRPVVAPPLEEVIPDDRALEPPPPTEPVAAPRRAMARPTNPPPRPPPRLTRAAAQPKALRDERVAALDRMSTGFFNQSMANTGDSKKLLLVAARDRSVAQRKACRSDSCVADAYVRQIRETSAIMESKSVPPK